MSARLRASFALLAACLLGGCDHAGNWNAGRGREFAAGEGGADSDRGAKLIVQYGCGNCHTVPGISRARGRVGPPLDFFSERSYIGGELPNTPETLVHWIMDAPALIPATAMPNLDVGERDARDIAAYLYTLH
jgi:mono/diheme cytochrome c family protein